MKSILKNRWFLGTLMLLALALAVWFIGPAIAVFDYRPLEGIAARLLIIVVVASIWLGIELGRLWAARQANKKLLEGIAATGPESDATAAKSAEEIASLHQRFEEAATTLKKARFEGGSGEKQYLYELPWYVFIGAPGSGKTTALTNSGLRFPLGEGPEGLAVKGVGGTRNCDWWFTDEAVLLDTAGRYTTQESEQKVDAAAWLGFLDLLKKHRPRRPLNGAIITISVYDLLIWSETDRARYCDAVRQRIHELYSHLEIRFPLYVMVTKCDLLAGFNEYFANFGREERAQVLGMTFPFSPKATAATDYSAQFGSEFQAIENRLNTLLLDRLQPERDQQRRALIYNFPQQFSGLKVLLEDFVKNVFQGSRYAEQPMLRGVYFTSGTQEGSPIDRVLGTLARSFKLERKILAPSVSSGKSYFLTNLLKEVIFPEAGLVGANAKLEQRLKLVLHASYVVVAVLSVCLLALWGLSFINNRALIADFDVKAQAVKQQVEKLPPPRAGDYAAIYPVLTALRALSEPYSSPDVPWSLGFGLYQGDKLGSEARRVYQNALRDALLPRIALRLEQLLREGPAVDQYDALKAYLMLYMDKVLDPKALSGFVARDWQRTYASTDSAQFVKALQEHLQAALSNRPLEMVYPQNAQLVNETRQRLASASLPERIYARMRQEVELADLQPFRLSDAAGPAAAQVFVRSSRRPLTEGVSGMFTVAGYTKVIRPTLEDVAKRMLDEEVWVLGQKSTSLARASATVQTLDDVRRRYFEDYMRAWDDFFGDVQLAPSSSLSQSVQFVRLLSGADSPLKRLLESAAKETSLVAGGDGSVKSTMAKAATDAVVGFAKKALGSSADKIEEALPSRPEAVVDEHFKPLRQYVTAPAGTKPPIDLLSDALKEYVVRLDAISDALRRGDTAGQKLLDVGQLRAVADQAPAPARQIIRNLLDTSVAQATGVAREKLASDVGGASLFCDKAIRGRYPFTKNAQGEVTLDDFGKVFGPGGDLDEFFVKNLAPMVDTSKTQWRPRSGGPGPTLSAQTIGQFQRAAEIRDAFFRGGAKMPAISAELSLVQLDDKLTHATLEIDNQVLRFDRVASLPVRVGWPGQRPGGRIRLQVYPTGAALTFEGAWALFRLIERGSPQVGSQPELLKLAYTLDGARVAFELRASSAVNNPFQLRALEEFRCPSRN